MAIAGNGPMGGGVDVDILTRQPVTPKSPQAAAAEAKARMEEAVLKAISLQHDLQKSPVLELLLTQFHGRLDELAKNDPVCQTILGVLTHIRNMVDILPEYAHKRFRNLLGNSISVPPFSPCCAPEGIPQEEQNKSPGPKGHPGTGVCMAQGATATPESDTQGTPNAQAKPVEVAKEGGLGDALG